MRGKSLALMLFILIFGATSILSTNAATPPPDHVKVYVWNPAAASNVYPTKAYPVTTFCEIWVDSPASWDDTPNGIVGWTISLRVDPNVAELLGSLQYPDTDFDGTSNGFLGNFLSLYGYNWMGYSLAFFPGTRDATWSIFTGTAEAILGFSTLGLGAGGGPAPLMRYVMRTKSGVDYTTAYSAIVLFDCYYTTVDGVKHPVDIVQSGHYGTPPPQFYMSGPPTDPLDPFTLDPITDPIGTDWHELYPTYCDWWVLTSWDDNGDGYLSPSDQIDMTTETGWLYWFHVDVVTTTIHWTFKAPDEGPAAAELAEYTEGEPITNPIGTTWHQIYPEYCKEFVITSWEDNDANGEFNPSDQFDFEYFGEEGDIHWAHLDEVTTDIILSQKGEPTPPTPEFPLGLEIMMMLAAAIPIVYIWRTRKWSGKK